MILFILASISLFSAGMIKHPFPRTLSSPTFSANDYEQKRNIQSVYVNSFGSSLYNSLIRDPENVFFSPLSIHQALMMTANGASNDTEQVFRNVLRLHELPANESIASSQYKITTGDARVNTLPLYTMANSLWINKKLDVYSDFITETEKAFDAAVKVADFGSRSTVNEINVWVLNKTEGLINNIISSLPSSTQLLLINALYFKQEWQHKFKPQDTRDDHFMSTVNGKEKCKMMHATRKMDIATTPDAKILSLPFANNNARIAIILPNDKGEKALTKITSKYLQNDQFREVLQNMQTKEVALSFPRLHVEFGKSVKDALSATGLGRVFSSSAQFERISPRSLSLSDVLHKAVLDIDEAGVQAAAATVVKMEMMGYVGGFSFPEPFVVNRPFALAIYDNRNKLIFFSGLIRHIGPKAISFSSTEL